MCEKCKAIDDRIRRYEKIAGWIIDGQTTEGIKGLIGELEKQKLALHPKRQ